MKSKILTPEIVHKSVLEHFLSINKRHAIFHAKRLVSHIEFSSKGCWIWRGYLCRGYARFGNDMSMARVHRFLYRILVGPIPDDRFGCHTCDNKACVNPSHIFVGEGKDNFSDMWNKDRAVPFGRRNYQRNGFNEDTVRLIKELNRGGLSKKQIAKRLNLSPSRVSRICNGKRWAWVGNQEQIDGEDEA